MALRMNPERAPPRSVIGRTGWLVVAAFLAACALVMSLGWALGDARAPAAGRASGDFSCFVLTLNDGRRVMVCPVGRGVRT